MRLIPAWTKKPLRSALLLATFALPAAHAQDDFIIEESEQSSGSWFEQHASGGLLASYAGGIGDNTRSHGAFKVRINDDIRSGSGLSYALESWLRASRVELAFENYLVDEEGHFTSEKEQYTKTASDSNLELRDAYLRYSRGIFDVYIGRRAFAIGQFDAFSPVDFLLPIDFSRGTVSFSKLDNHYLQTAASLSLFPTNNLEMAVHYFPRIERDPISKKLFEEDIGAEFNTPDDESQYMARLLYTGARAILGLTYYKGFEIFPADFPTLSGDADAENTDNATIAPSYLKIDGLGFELSIPRGRYSWKYEVLLSQTAFDLGDCMINNDVAGENTPCQDYREHLAANFDNKAYLAVDAMFHGIGFDYNGEKWTVNLSIYAYTIEPDDRQQAALDLSERTGYSSDRHTSDAAFPAIHVAREYANARHTTGFGAGFFGAAAGMTVYHLYQYSDAFDLGFSLDLLSFQGDNQIEDQEEDESPGADRISDFDPSLRFTLNYSF